MLNKEDILALAWEHSEGSGNRYIFTEESLFAFLKELTGEPTPAKDERHAQTEQQPLYQVRRYGEGWQDVDHIRYVACQDDLDYYTRELYVAESVNRT